MTRKLSRSLAGVIIFSVLAGVCSGFVTSASFMPAYSLYYNWRRWYPGSEEVMVLGQVDGFPESRVIYASGWEGLREAGLPATRLWLFDAETAQEPVFALVAHGIWRANLLRLRDEITLNLQSEQVTVPVAGVWHPFHPQLGDAWVILVGEADIFAASGASTEVLAPIQSPVLPGNFRGRNLLSWLLFNALGFILYGTMGLLDIKGRCAVAGWAAKLWAGAAAAVPAGLLTSAIVFRAFLPLPLLCLLPMTLAVLAASYLLAVLLLSLLCIALSRMA